MNHFNQTKTKLNMKIFCFILMATSLSLSAKSDPNEIKYLDYFASAYQAYPDIPYGYLEAMAYVNTRWQPLKSTGKKYQGHHERPQTVGIMGLHQGDFAYLDQVALAAQALGVSESEVRNSTATSIMATAALISSYLNKSGLKQAQLEDMAAVTQTMLASPTTTKSGAVNDYIAASQFYDMLLILDKGHDDHGIFILDQHIPWTQAFDGKM